MDTDNVLDERTEALVYSQLDPGLSQIRVLNIDAPETEDSRLRCHMEVISLANDQDVKSFEAVSYCWGDSATKTEVEIDGCSYRVPLNSEAALRCLSHRHGRLCIWIDAICIDQNNVEERNQQVAVMDRIYSLARRVLVWLGDLPSRPFSPLLAVKRLMVDVEKNMGPRWEDAVGHHQPVAPGAWSPEPLKNMLGPPIWAIWSSKWFTRLWVIQEIVLAREVAVFHDKECVPFSHLVAAAWASHLWVPDVRGQDILRGPGNASMMNTLITSYRDGAPSAMFSFGLLLWQTQTYQRTEPRDKIYALLGLWKERFRSRKLPLGIDVDYTKSFAEIYAQALRVAILDQGNFDPLTGMTVASLGESATSGELPSWAPSPDVYTSYQRPFEMSHNYQTGSGKDFRNVRRANDTTSITMDVRGTSRDEALTLILKGVATDEVRHLSPLDGNHVYAKRAEPGASININIRHFVEYMSALLSWIKSHISDREDEDLIHQLLNTWMGREVDETEHDQVPEYGRVFREELLVFLKEHAAGEELKYKRLVCTVEDRITEITIRASMAFTVFITADLRVGLGSRQTQVGDRVCILYGGGTPIILRPCKPRWTWVGPTYLDDLVDGSYIQGLREGGKLEDRSEFFEIR